MTRNPLASMVPSTVPKRSQGKMEDGTGIWTHECFWPAVGQDDLRWWLETAPTLNWRFARTYANSAPHSYLMRDSSNWTLTLEEYHRALSVIWAFGRPENYWSNVGIYLHDRDRGIKWWGHGAPVYGWSLINQSEAGLSYGKQRFASFSTAPGRITDLTGQAPAWDEEHTTNDHDRVTLWRMLNPDDRSVGRVLDLTARTGAAVDLRLADADPKRYQAVETTRALLNRLVIKHPWIEQVTDMPIVDVLQAAPPVDTVVALEADSLLEHEIIAAARLAARQALFVFRDGVGPVELGRFGARRQQLSDGRTAVVVWR